MTKSDAINLVFRAQSDLIQLRHLLGFVKNPVILATLNDLASKIEQIGDGIDAARVVVTAEDGRTVVVER